MTMMMMMMIMIMIMIILVTYHDDDDDDDDDNDDDDSIYFVWLKRWIIRYNPRMPNRQRRLHLGHPVAYHCLFCCGFMHAALRLCSHLNINVQLSGGQGIFSIDYQVTMESNKATTNKAACFFCRKKTEFS